MTNPFSDWVWDPRQGSYYRWRYNAQGHREFEWLSPHQQSVNQSSASTISIPQTNHVPTSNGSPPARVPRRDSHQAQYTYPLPPDPRIRGNIRTRNENTDYETFDPSYRRVAPRYQDVFFCFGRVFKMLWTEPAAEGAMNGARRSAHFSVVTYNQTAYSCIRWFVVVRNKGLYSLCIPIHTYEGRGATKPGLRVEEHAVIYTGPSGTSPPSLLQGENIDKFSLRVEPDPGQDPRHSLEPTSRINFGRTYTVEHNTKVLSVGKVAPEHHWLLEGYWQEANA